MRVLALAALDVPYIRDNWMDAVAHVLGHDAVVVNVTPLVACSGPDGHVRYINRLVATNRFDYAFLYHDYVFADFDDDFFGYLRGAGLRTVAFHPDDEGEVWYQRNRAFDGRFDVIATHSRLSADRRCREKRPTRPFYLPWGFNQRFFDRPAGAPAKKYDVVFVGKYKVHDQDRSRFREDGRQRDDVLCRVADYCRRRGRVFRIFGHGWEKHYKLAPFAGGVLAHREMLDVYHSARIVLNPGWSADRGDSVPQTKLRHFEVAGCGAFQLTNENPELADLFERDEEIAFFEDEEDLCARIEVYLGDDARREHVALSGYRRAHRDHTLDARVRTLFAQMKAWWPPAASVQPTPRPPRITAVDLASLDEVRRLRDDLAAGRRQFDRADGVHVRLCGGVIERASYGELAGVWRARADVFGIRCFYDTRHAWRNPLQPLRHEIQGGLLGHQTALRAIRGPHRTALVDQLGGLTDEDYLYPLVNYVARREAVGPLLDAFLSGDPARVRALHALTTGLVLTELRLDTPNASAESTPGFVAALREALDHAAALDLSVALYGARGEMAERSLEEIRSRDDVRLVAIIDRAMAGTRLAGVPVHGFFDLPALAPDLVLVAAAYSGPAIVEQLRPLEPRMSILPLYDLQASAWALFVA